MTLRQRHRCNLTAAALLLALLPGCGTEDRDTTGSMLDANAGPSAATDAGQCVAQACSCSTGTGTRRCDALGQLGTCECAAALAPEDAAIVIVGICPTGRYAGNFEGSAGFLVPTTDVSGLDLFNDRPPLQITLSPPAGDQEFVVVGDGVMHGNANGTFPFDATFHGKLNCNTKRFEATLSGSVQLFLEGIRNDFTGRMEASYDTDAHAFVAGKWTVTGDADAGNDLGLTGNGSWMAVHTDAGVDGGP